MTSKFRKAFQMLNPFTKSGREEEDGREHGQWHFVPRQREIWLSRWAKARTSPLGDMWIRIIIGPGVAAPDIGCKIWINDKSGQRVLAVFETILSAEQARVLGEQFLEFSDYAQDIAAFAERCAS